MKTNIRECSLYVQAKGSDWGFIITKKTKNINLLRIFLVLVQGKCIYINDDIYKITTIIFNFSSYLASIFEMFLLLYSKFLLICLGGMCLIGS